jgi:membrane-bound lytic murein transglycosylase D
MVTQLMHFDQIASVLNVDKEELRALNPQYKKDIIPGNEKPYVLKLPSTQACSFGEKENTIASYNADALFTNRSTVDDATEKMMQERTGKKLSRSGTRLYKVKVGESYHTIARKFPGYDSADLMKLNNTRNSSLKRGQYIRVPKI